MTAPRGAESKIRWWPVADQRAEDARGVVAAFEGILQIENGNSTVGIPNVKYSGEIRLTVRSRSLHVSDSLFLACGVGGLGMRSLCVLGQPEAAGRMDNCDGESVVEASEGRLCVLVCVGAWVTRPIEPRHWQREMC